MNVLLLTSTVTSERTRKRYTSASNFKHSLPIQNNFSLDFFYSVHSAFFLILFVWLYPTKDYIL